MARARALAGECGGLTEGDRISQAGIAASGEFSYPLNQPVSIPLGPNREPHSDGRNRGHPVLETTRPPFSRVYFQHLSF
jgi:hypothetical protein